MKKMKVLCIVIAVVVTVFVVLWAVFGEKVKVLRTSLQSFKDENLSHTFQHTPEIQPTKKINKGGDAFQFIKEGEVQLAEEFTFDGAPCSVGEYIEDTKTIGLLVIRDDTIKYEKYFAGGDENTLFSSNSMGKSFVSALMGAAVSEGYVESVEEPLGKYIPEFVGTQLENIPIRHACRWRPVSTLMKIRI